MVIHHDKLAYGKLASRTEELSEQDVLNMIKLLNAEEDKPQEEEISDKIQIKKCNKPLKNT